MSRPCRRGRGEGIWGDPGTCSLRSAQLVGGAEGYPEFCLRGGGGAVGGTSSAADPELLEAPKA